MLRAAGSEVWLEAEAAHAAAQIAWESVEEIYQEEMHNAWDPIYEFLGQRPPPDTEFGEDEATPMIEEEAELSGAEALGLVLIVDEEECLPNTDEWHIWDEMSLADCADYCRKRGIEYFSYAESVSNGTCY